MFKTGLRLMMFGLSIFLPRCLCWCGFSFATGFLRKTIWCSEVFFFQRTVCVAGCDDIESATHLFLHCNTFSQ